MRGREEDKMIPGKRKQAGQCGPVLVLLLIMILLLVEPAAAEVCWGKICAESPLKETGLCAVCCSGHGTCESFNNCACESGYTGKECETPSFCGSCSNMCNTTMTGECSNTGSSGVCYCKNGYSGVCCTVTVGDLDGGAGMLVPSSWEFGTVTIGSVAALPATASYVNDKSGMQREIESITVSGTNAGDFVPDTSTCGPGVKIPPKGTCTIPVTFTPLAKGSRTATLTVVASVFTFNASFKDTRSYTMSLNGTGISPVSSIVIDPVSESYVFAGFDGASIYRSTDSGASWLPATLTPVTKRVKALVMKPGDGTTLYSGSYGGGVYTSTDRGITWKNCPNTGLLNLNVLSLVSDTSGKLYAGTENGAYTSTDNCASWTAVNTGLP
jgi:hypothetical protein